jgi:hypothetical protein
MFNTKIQESSTSICQYTAENLKKYQVKFQETKNPFLHIAETQYMTGLPNKNDVSIIKDAKWLTNGLTQKLTEDMFRKITFSRMRVSTTMHIFLSEQLFKDINQSMPQQPSTFNTETTLATSSTTNKKPNDDKSQFNDWSTNNVDENQIERFLHHPQLEKQHQKQEQVKSRKPFYKVMLNCFCGESKWEFPNSIKIIINGKTINHLYLYGNKSPIDLFGLDISKYMCSTLNTVVLEMASPVHQDIQFSLNVVEFCFVENFLPLVQYIDTESAKNILFEYDHEQKQQHIIQKYPLIDAISKTRINVPARFKTCKHKSCFDIITLLKAMFITNTLKCPICSEKNKFQNILIDGFQHSLVDILRKTRMIPELFKIIRYENGITGVFYIISESQDTYLKHDLLLDTIKRNQLIAKNCDNNSQQTNDIKDFEKQIIDCGIIDENNNIDDDDDDNDEDDPQEKAFFQKNKKHFK